MQLSRPDTAEEANKTKEASQETAIEVSDDFQETGDTEMGTNEEETVVESKEPPSKKPKPAFKPRIVLRPRSHSTPRKGAAPFKKPQTPKKSASKQPSSKATYKTTPKSSPLPLRKATQRSQEKKEKAATPKKEVTPDSKKAQKLEQRLANAPTSCPFQVTFDGFEKDRLRKIAEEFERRDPINVDLPVEVYQTGSTDQEYESCRDLTATALKNLRLMAQNVSN